MNLNRTYQSLRNTQIDWSKFLVNPRYDKENHRISWKKYKPRDKLVTVHRSNVLELVNEKQYSFQVMDDGSIFQLYYEYDHHERTIQSANLAFYNTGGITSETFQELFSENETSEFTSDTIPSGYEELIDTNNDDPIVPWFRIDYSPQILCRPLHHSCHLHIGLFQNARFPLTRVPSPRQFIEFVIAFCYPKKYESKRLNSNFEPANFEKMSEFNSECFHNIDSRVYQILPHICIPSH